MFRRSPVHDLLAAHRPEWREIAGCQLAWRVGSPAAEAAALRRLALCDLSPLLKLGLRGAGAGRWLTKQGITVPAGVYETGRLDDGGWIVRTGTHDLFLESGLPGTVVQDVDHRFNEGIAGVVRVGQQEATFLLSGEGTGAVLAQTCAIDFRAAPRGRLLMTRIAGASCSILPEPHHPQPRYRIWVDPSLAWYLWETVESIVRQLEGEVVGAGVIEQESNGR